MTIFQIFLTNCCFNLNNVLRNSTRALLRLMKIAFNIRNTHTEKDKKERGNGDNHRQLPLVLYRLDQISHLVFRIPNFKSLYFANKQII